MIYVGIKNSMFKSKILAASSKIGQKKTVKLPCLCADDCSRHFEILKRFDAGERNFRDTEYYKFNRSNGKSHKATMIKIKKFKKIYDSIKENGYQTGKGHIVVSSDGARLDGSHRSSIVEHLGFSELEVIVVKWEDMFKEKRLASLRKHIKSQKKRYNA